MLRVLQRIASTSKLAALIKTLIDAGLGLVHVLTALRVATVRRLITAVKLWHSLDFEEGFGAAFIFVFSLACFCLKLPVWHPMGLSAFVVAQERVRVQVSRVVVDSRLVTTG